MTCRRPPPSPPLIEPAPTSDAPTEVADEPAEATENNTASEPTPPGEEAASASTAEVEQVADKSPVDWDPEELSAQVSAALKKIMHLPLAAEDLDDDALAAVAVAEVTVKPLRPAGLEQTYRDDALRIFKQSEARDEPASGTGLSALRDAVLHLAEPF